ncbi:MAG: MFS transporter [Sulfolobales archaeon]|nr:MFS transporter [Sulfolobales archaeon]
MGLALASLSFFSTLLLRIYWGSLAPYLISRGVSEELIGLVGSAFFAGYVVSQIPGGILGDRKGPGFAMGLGLIFSGFFNTLFYLVDSESWVWVSLAVGLLSGTVYGPSVKLVKILFPQNTERAMGVYSVAWSLPFLTAPWLISGVVESGDPGYVHMVVGILCISVGAADLVLLRRVGARDPGQVLGDLIPTLWRYRGSLVLVSLGGFLTLYYNWVIAYWTPYYIVLSGFSTVEASLAMSVFSIAGLVSMPLAGILASRLGVMRLMIVDLILYSASGILLSQYPSGSLLLPLMTILGFTRFVTTPLNSTILSMIFPRSVLSTASSIVNTFWQLSGAAAPIITAILLKATSPGNAMLVSSLAPLLAAIPYSLLARTLRPRS